MTQPYLSLIVPAYNEEQRLQNCLNTLTSYFYHYTKIPFEVVVVLNGCTDHTAVIAYAFANRWPQVKVVELVQKGKGRAVQAGMLAAKGKLRMMLDVDLSMPVGMISNFIGASEHAGVVVGHRSHLRTNLLRWLAHEIFRRLCRPLTKINDPQCGFKLFSAACADEVFRKLSVPGWGFDVEALHLAELAGYRVVEIEIPWTHDRGSKLRPVRDGYKMLRDLMYLRSRYAA